MEQFSESGERGLVFIGPKGVLLRRSGYGGGHALRQACPACTSSTPRGIGTRPSPRHSAALLARLALPGGSAPAGKGAGNE